MQKFLARLFARLMKSWSWVLLIVLTILIKWASWYPAWVERNYSQGLYPYISKTQRILFGWIPFSVGDLFYAFLILIVLFKTGKFFKLLFKKKLNRAYFVVGLQQAIFFMLFMYVFFNLFWGLNYNRKGIAHQLQLDVKPYSLNDLDTLTSVLQSRVNHYANSVTEAQRDSFNKKAILFNHAHEVFNKTSDKLSFIRYSSKSVKPSMYSYLGNYLGFQGYYNPFSGEAQVNTTVPRFLEPFVTLHEIAHQIGYGRENEANFVGYLASLNTENNAFRYSAYYDMYKYALVEIFKRDNNRGMIYLKAQHPQIRKDQMENAVFYRRYRNPIGPLVMQGYGEFLKANNQPSGLNSYNEVVAWLIAYYKKYGTAAL